ncbi:hypothetical protein ACFQX8_08870 [Klenkia terrae]|uniref:hypothetical protein n=1 Tax=Klenkia terrae TaxID=1052259 RepID=UPI003615A075
MDRARWSPSAEDTQPWWWVLLPDRLELRLDRSRCVDHDPTGLVALAGAGAALCTAEVGAAAVGVAVDVQVLPDPADEALVAVLRPGGRSPIRAWRRSTRWSSCGTPAGRDWCPRTSPGTWPRTSPARPLPTASS